MLNEIFSCDNLKFMRAAHNQGRRWDMVFADPPDNIDLGYDGVDDKLEQGQYYALCYAWLYWSLTVSDVVWWSFNAKHTIEMAQVVGYLQNSFKLDVKPCVQIFTFGQHNKNDLGNNHRPLWRLSRSGTLQLFPDQVKVPSWRQLNGDKRAKEGGRVPGDVVPHDPSVYDFPRVTGNSKQRRPWHPTQLHESMVEQCIKLCTQEGASVLDPFGGTGTTLRVCKRINRSCTLVEKSPAYARRIAREHQLELEKLDACTD
jgi:DNA modification methylase